MIHKNYSSEVIMTIRKKSIKYKYECVGFEGCYRSIIISYFHIPAAAAAAAAAAVAVAAAATATATATATRNSSNVMRMLWTATSIWFPFDTLEKIVALLLVVVIYIRERETWDVHENFGLFAARDAFFGFCHSSLFTLDKRTNFSSLFVD
jgi:hypothetical protein